MNRLRNGIKFQMEQKNENQQKDVVFKKVCPTCKGLMSNQNMFCCLRCYNERPKEEG